MNSISLDIIINRINSHVDHSLGFSASTPELTTEEKVAFMELQGCNLKAVLTPIDEPNVPEVKVDKDLESKTPGQRLRAVLYVLWEQGKKEKEFEVFYKYNIERFIDLIKEKLL
jgi:hypothetical protein